MKPRLRMLPLFLVLLGAARTLAGAGPLVVIVNLDSGVNQLSRAEVTDLFLGRQKRLAPKLVALPVDLADPEVRGRFYDLLVNLPLPQVRALWARLYFSGQAQPPRMAESAEEVLQLVAANRGAVGFIEQDKLDRRVKAVFRLGE